MLVQLDTRTGEMTDIRPLRRAVRSRTTYRRYNKAKNDATSMLLALLTLSVAIIAIQ